MPATSSRIARLHGSKAARASGSDAQGRSSPRASVGSSSAAASSSTARRSRLRGSNLARPECASSASASLEYAVPCSCGGTGRCDPPRARRDASEPWLHAALVDRSAARLRGGVRCRCLPASPARPAGLAGSRRARARGRAHAEEARGAGSSTWWCFSWHDSLLGGGHRLPLGVPACLPRLPRPRSARDRVRDRLRAHATDAPTRRRRYGRGARHVRTRLDRDSAGEGGARRVRVPPLQPLAAATARSRWAAPPQALARAPRPRRIRPRRGLPRRRACPAPRGCRRAGRRRSECRAPCISTPRSHGE